MSKQLTIGITDLSFHHIAGSLIFHVLRDFGFNVRRVYAKHEHNFKMLAQGNTDILCSAWLHSSHGMYRAEVEKTTTLLELGLHYQPYALWGVPHYIPEESIQKVADLLKPDIKKKMKPIIQGINPGAGITRFSLKIMEDYKLSKAGYTFYTGTEEACFSAFEQAYAQEEWIVVPLWRPQFLHYKYHIRELEEPKGLLGKVDKAVMLLRSDIRNRFSDEQIQILDSLRFSNDIISELDYQVCREKRPLDTVTKEWLDHNIPSLDKLNS